VPSEQNVESLHVTAVHKIATYSTKVTEHLDSVCDVCDLYPGRVLLDSRSDHWLFWLWFFLAYLVAPGVRGGTIGWITALQAGRSRVLFLVGFGSTTSLGSTQTLMEMGFRNISWTVRAAVAYDWQPYHLRVPIVSKSGSLNFLSPSSPIQGLLYFYLVLRCSYRYIIL
jgi:hypothetical protein